MAWRPALISARFDGGRVEAKMREAHAILRERGCNVLMVDAGVGDDFGKMTMSYLQQVEEEKGVLVAVCTEHYAEITSSAYSSYGELSYAVDRKIAILPLKMSAVYPPEPPFGPDHPFDNSNTHGDGRALVKMAFPKSLAYADCVSSSPEQIAEIIQKRLGRDDPPALAVAPAAYQDTSVPQPLLQARGPRGSQRSRPSGPAALVAVSAAGGWFIDYICFHFSDGSERFFGTFIGNPPGRIDLLPGEVVTEISGTDQDPDWTWLWTFRYHFMGGEFVVRTNMKRQMAYHSEKASECKHHYHFTAPEGITGLRLQPVQTGSQHGTIVGVVTGDAS